MTKVDNAPEITICNNIARQLQIGGWHDAAQYVSSEFMAGHIRADLASGQQVRALRRAPESERNVGWTISMDLLADLRSSAGDWGHPIDLEAVELIALEVERRILAALAPAPDAAPAPGIAEAVETPSDEAIEALASYQQADMDGIMVLVSRQAIEECLSALRALQGERQ